MNVQPGTRLGPYEIVEPIGAGGMGEVYRAKDTRLERDVAVKVLPSGLSENPQFLQRFEREAKAISSLNHPNICTLHDVGHTAPRDEGATSDTPPVLHYIVMELIEGESLADRLRRGPLPLHEVLRHGSEIADALDAAHRRGIVHRDLKPGNVMLTRSGAKLLDFGLARTAAEGHAPIQGVTSLPTEHKPLTQEGTILGTFQYMAPEQLEGLEADARTDIFAFGALLYEMATGRRAFQGNSRTSLIASIVSSQPEPIASVTTMAPPALDHVVRKCLEKDPDRRWQSAYDVASELRWIDEAGSQAGVASPIARRRASRERLAWGLAALTVIAAVAFAVLWTRGRAVPETPQVLISSLVSPAELRFDYGIGGLAISPDGQRVAFLARGDDGVTRIWIRSMQSIAPRALAGTDHAIAPFWSPDSQFIGFFADGKLKKIDANGGPPQTLSDAPSPRGGTWGPDGTIVFCPAYGELHAVSLTGGSSRPLTKLAEKETNHRWPLFLPDGKHLLYLSQTADRGAIEDQSAIYILDIESGEQKRLIDANSAPLWSPPGLILFWKEGFLLAQQFDLDGLELQGQPFPVAEDVDYTNWEYPVASASMNGSLVYHAASGAGQSELVWFSRDGSNLGTELSSGNYSGFKISHDRTRLVYETVNDRSAGADLWIRDLERATQSRLTFNPGDDYLPIWSRDDEWLYFGSSQDGTDNVYRKRSNGLGSEEKVLDKAYPFDLFPGEQFLLVDLYDDGTAGSDIAKGSIEQGQIEPLIGTPHNEFAGSLSPDGRFIAYVSGEAGRPDIFIQSLDRGGKWQVSSDSGLWPLWVGDEIFFMNTPRTELWSVPVSSGDRLTIGTPQKLLDLPFQHGDFRPYDVTSDGERILANVFGSTTRTNPLTLVQNWYVPFASQITGR